MSRSYDLGYSSFDSRHDWLSPVRHGLEPVRRVLEPVRNGLEPIQNGLPMTNGLYPVRRDSKDERSNRQSPARSGHARYQNGLDPFSNGSPGDWLSPRVNGTARSGSRGRLSSSQEAIQEIHRALSPSVEDFENYVRNTYSQSVPPSPGYEREVR